MAEIHETQTVAADGRTPVFYIPGYPLMVRAVDFNAAVRATPAPGAPAGFKLVPIEPTPEMIAAWAGAEYGPLKGLTPEEADAVTARADWQAMLDAAPGAPGQEAAAVQAVGAWQPSTWQEQEARYEQEMSEVYALEKAAQALYEQWASLPGYVPWVEGGNSDRQEDARRLARAALPPSGAGEKTS